MYRSRSRKSRKPRVRWAIRRSYPILLVPFLLTGCFALAPLEGTSPVPGDQVRLTLSPDAAERLSERTGRPVRSVDGRVLAGASEVLTLEVRWSALHAGAGPEARRDTLALEPSEIESVQRRELSRARTGLAVGGVVAILAALARTISTDARGTPPGGDGPTPF